MKSLTIKKIIREYKGIIYFDIILGVLISIIAGLSVVSYQKLIDTISNVIGGKHSLTEVIQSLGTVFWIYCILSLLDCILNYLSNYPEKFEEKSIYQYVKCLAVEKISKISYIGYQNLGTGRMLQIAENGADASVNILCSYYLKIVKEILPQTIISLCILGIYNINSMVIISIGYAVVFFISNKFLKKLYAYKETILVDYELFSKKNVRAIMEMVTFRTNRKYKKELNTLKRVSREIVNNETKIVMLHELFFASFYFLVILVKIAIILFSVLSGNKGTTIGILVASLDFVDRIYNPIAEFNVLHVQYKLDRITLKKFDDFLSEAETENIYNGLPIADINGAIDIKNIYFKYEDKEILKNVTIHIEPGQTIAIVGQSGVGKSTIIKLLAGLIRPQSGEIVIEHNNLEEIKLDDYYKYVSYISQACPIYDGTILENLDVSPDVTEDSIMKTLKALDLHSIISDSGKGLLTEIGEKGIKLSGGERQLIAVARYLLGKKTINLLDEITSSMDYITESKVMDVITQYKRDVTNIIIAHRLSTLKNVDCIYVLNSGEVCEQGNYHELVCKNGLFKEMLDKQNQDI